MRSVICSWDSFRGPARADDWLPPGGPERIPEITGHGDRRDGGGAGCQRASCDGPHRRDTRETSTRPWRRIHEALKNDPHRADANQRLAVVHDRLGRFQESAGYYAKALAAAPGDAEIFCDKGYSLYLQRRWAEADMCLRQAIALKPRLARAHNNLGLLLARDGKVDEALAEFRAAGLPPRAMRTGTWRSS